jgi:hypothetical protein
VTPTIKNAYVQMYRREGKDGIPSMVEAVPFKFARETLKRLPRRAAKVIGRTLD